MTEKNNNEIVSRVVNTYTASLSLLGLISSGGLAAAGTLFQSERTNVALMFLTLFFLLLSLCSAFFASNCLVGLAKKEDPSFKNKYLSRSAACAAISMILGIILLLVVIFTQRAEDKMNSFTCNCLCPKAENKILVKPAEQRMCINE